MKYTRRAVLTRAFGMLSLAACLASVSSGRAFAAQDLPNFYDVAPGITRGAAPTEAGLEKLKAMGVHTIIDLRYSPVKEEKAQAQKLGFTWINLPMGAEAPTQKQVDTFLATLKKAPGEPVFVHCQHGADRTGCMIGIWRVTQQGWTFLQAWAEMRKYGFNPKWTELTGAVKERVKESGEGAGG